MNLAHAKNLCLIASKSKDPVAALALALMRDKDDMQRSITWLAYMLLTGHEPPIQRTPQWVKIQDTVRAFISNQDCEWLRVHAHDQQPVIKMVTQISHGKIHTRLQGKQKTVHVPNFTQDYDISHPSDEARAQMVEWRKKHGIPYVGSRMIAKKKKDTTDEWSARTSLI